MKRFWRENALLVATVISVVLGVLVGALCRLLNPSSDTILLVGFPGEIFLRMLKMLMLPLVVGSIITGVGSLKGASSGRIGFISLLYYLTSSLVALLIALAFGMTIKPGSHSQDLTAEFQIDRGTQISGADVFLDLFRNVIPDNIVGAAVQHSRTVAIGNPTDSAVLNVSNISAESLARHGEIVKETQLFPGENVIGLLVYCTVFGVILSRMGRQGSVIARLFDGINKITHQMIKVIMWYVLNLENMYSPVGILFLIASQVMASKDLSWTGQILGMYMAAEISALLVHLLIALPLMYFILTRGNVFKVYTGAMQALVTAFATSSSAAALPVTMRCVETKLKMDARIFQFVLPVGTTINMDGTAVYFIMGPIFISQYNGVNMSVSDILLISVVAMFSSVGTSALPGVHFPILLLVLKAVGLPDRGVFFLLTIDWFMDRLRTMVNVAGDCIAVGVTSRYARLPSRELAETDLLPGDEIVQMTSTEEKKDISSCDSTITEV